jgi:hypothetical protein
MLMGILDGLFFVFALEGKWGEGTVIKYVFVVKEIKSLKHHSYLFTEMVDLNVRGCKILSMKPDMP